VKVFSPIIPNSQLYVLANNQDSEKWQLELFINPDKTLVLIVIMALAFLVVIGVVIVVMHVQEKKEDSKNRPQIDF